MLNNKGFAVTTILYTLLIVFLMFLGAALAQFSSSSSIIGKANDDLINGTKLEAKQVKVKNVSPWYNTNTIVKINSRYGTMYFPRDFYEYNNDTAVIGNAKNNGIYKNIKVECLNPSTNIYDTCTGLNIKDDGDHSDNPETFIIGLDNDEDKEIFMEAKNDLKSLGKEIYDNNLLEKMVVDGSTIRERINESGDTLSISDIVYEGSSLDDIVDYVPSTDVINGLLSEVEFTLSYQSIEQYFPNIMFEVLDEIRNSASLSHDQFTLDDLYNMNTYVVTITLKLKNSIEINGNNVDKLSYSIPDVFYVAKSITNVDEEYAYTGILYFLKCSESINEAQNKYLSLIELSKQMNEGVFSSAYSEEYDLFGHGLLVFNTIDTNNDKESRYLESINDGKIGVIGVKNFLKVSDNINDDISVSLNLYNLYE